VERPLLAVIFGTFTLRLSTGLTGGMLVFYLANLPTYGGEPVDALAVGMLGALFYASELVGSPMFGILSDRVGHRRIMQVGPVFGRAVIITAVTPPRCWAERGSSRGSRPPPPCPRSWASSRSRRPTTSSTAAARWPGSRRPPWPA
jgi:MFS family permease